MGNTKPKLDFDVVKRQIAEGNLELVLKTLLEFIEGIEASITTEIYMTSARYRSLKTEKIRGEISTNDYKTEFNSITYTLLEIIKVLSKLNLETQKEKASKEQLKSEIEELSKEFAKTDVMKSITAELRMKIHIARKMAEKMMPWPDLIQEYKGSSDPAIICAIGRKVKIVADIEELVILESLVPHANNNLTKGFIVNGVAELIYSGQLRLGDEITLREMLNTLKKDGNIVISSHIDAVTAILDFMTGVTKW